MYADRLLEAKKDSGGFSVDCYVINDGAALKAVRRMRERKCAVLDPGKVLAVVDQTVPSNSPQCSMEQRELMEFARDMGLEFSYGTGMCGHLLLDRMQRGGLAVGCDPLIAMAGARGALGICLEPGELAEALESGRVRLGGLGMGAEAARGEAAPGGDFAGNTTLASRILAVRLAGKLPAGVQAMDAALALVRELTPAALSGRIVEFAGGRELSEADRMVLCAVAAAAGARSAIFGEGDEGEAGIETAAGACAHTLDLSQVRPMAALPGGFDRISDLAEVSNHPAAGNCLAAGRHPAASQPLKVSSVFVGGAAGGNLEDIRQIAEAVRGKKVAYGLRLSVAPATTDIYIEAADRGYLTDIMEAGGLVLNQCASPAVQSRIGEGEYMVSNDLYNSAGYAGSLGEGIYLTSTATAVSCALTGLLKGDAR